MFVHCLKAKMNIVTFPHWLLTCGQAFLILYKLAELQVYKTPDRLYLYLLSISDSSLNCPEIPGNAT